VSRERWLEFHDSTVLAVQLDSMRAVIDLDGYFHLWEGDGSSRRGSGWTHHVQLELDFPAVEGELTTLPARLSDGRVISKSVSYEEGMLTVPVSIARAVSLELTTSSGETLRIAAQRFRAQTVGKPRFVEALPNDMDPERNAK
jgi:hypothetical protein